MKKYLSTIFALLFIAFISVSAIAQDSKGASTKASSGKVEKKEAYDTKKNDQKKEVKKETKRKEVKERKEKEQDKNKIGAEKKDALTDYEGNEGVDKGKPKETKKSELTTKIEKSDKEEKSDKLNTKGKNIADEARIKNEEKKRELKQSLSTASSKINDANLRIKMARAGLERSYKDGNITEKEYEEKKGRIEKAEKKVKELEEKVIKNKRLSN